mgnify:CR=1 FL=1
MNLFELPCDIKYYINENFLKSNHIRLLNTSGMYIDNQKENVIKDIQKNKKKLALYFLIKINQMKLFRKINTILNDHFTNFIGGMIGFNDSCLMYAPVAQYGVCRFCTKHLSEHKYDKMINIYLRLVASN